MDPTGSPDFVFQCDDAKSAVHLAVALDPNREGWGIVAGPGRLCVGVGYSVDDGGRLLVVGPGKWAWLRIHPDHRDRVKKDSYLAAGDGGQGVCLPDGDVWVVARAKESPRPNGLCLVVVEFFPREGQK